ncbi:MAG: 2Fe-2S iron-sulfur cluster binding domain-containing protein [Proteobacteria bacterium]|nr:2Fe-2S iron-sulfur cluster binding domain-containing protein [Pseudomonadota bacterium]
MAHTVVIDNTGEHYDCAADRSLLKGMESLGRKGIPVGCRGGGCGICRVQIVAGQVATQRMSREQVSAADEASGIVLACKAMPLTDVRLRVIGLKTGLKKCFASTPACR